METNKTKEPLVVNATRSQETKMRKAFTLIELVFVIAIAGISILVATQGYFKIGPPEEAAAQAKKAIHVLGALERVKSKYNGGTHVASAAVNIPDLEVLNLAMGGDRGTRDVSSWTYECAEGTNTELILTTEAYTSTEVRKLIVLELRQQQPWVTTESGENITITLAGITCTILP